MKKIQKVQLVNAPLSKYYVASSKAGAYPPLNLLTLTTYVKNQLPGIDIEIIDGEIIPLEQILSKLNAEIVGISAGILSYESAIQIAEEAARRGSLVILGGPYPSVIPNLILRNQPFIDAVVIGDGEESLLQFLLSFSKDNEFCKVPNLAFRKGSDVIFTHQVKTPIDSVPLKNYDFMDLTPYFENFKRNFPFKPFDSTLSVFSSKGCLWRDVSGGCIYCAMQTHGYLVKSPNIFWKEIEILNRKYGVKFFWDVTDTFTRPLSRLKELAKSKPTSLDVNFLFYGRSDDINDYVGSLLSQIGAYEVFLGVESGDDRILRNANRGQSSVQSLSAVKTLAKYNIKALVSFQVGLPGDNEESCRSSLKLAKELAETGNVSEVFSSMLLPIPGSSAFNMLVQHEDIREKYHDIDILPIEELRKDFIRKYCLVNYEYLSTIRDEIMSLFPLASSLGRPK